VSARMLAEHLGYLSDTNRNRLYQAAIRSVLMPGQRVVDLGCGSGLLGLYCLQQGAAFVDAIDETSIIEVARETFVREGFASRTQLHRSSSFATKLACPADLVVCDHVGYFGFDYGLIALLADAKTRFLRPDGRLMPRRLQLLTAAVTSDACRSKAEAWGADAVAPAYRWMRDRGTNSKHAVNLPAQALISDLGVSADLNLEQELGAYLTFKNELTISRDGLLDGILGCFRAELAEGIWMTNSPLADDAIQRPQAFLPISSRLEVHAGDVVLATLRIRPAENILAWELEHPRSGRRFSHSTFKNELFASEDLNRLKLTNRPRLSERGRLRQMILAMVDGRNSIEQIEQRLLREQPEALGTESELRQFVVSTLLRDAE